MNDRLHNTIMRRIYYAYAIRLVTMPGVLQGFVMLGALIALTYFVSIGNVVQNFLNIPVRDIGTFLYNAVATTEAWTLLLVGVFIYAALSFRFKILPMRGTHSYANA